MTEGLERRRDDGEKLVINLRKWIRNGWQTPEDIRTHREIGERRQGSTGKDTNGENTQLKQI